MFSCGEPNVGDIHKVTDHASAECYWESRQRTATGKLRANRSGGGVCNFATSWSMSDRDTNRYVWKTGDGSIAFRLWRTDVCTYHPDGSVTVRGYPSQLTAQFGASVLPQGMYCNADGSVTWAPGGETLPRWGDNTRWLRACGSLHLVPDGTGWALDPTFSTTRPFVEPVLDKRRAAQSLVECRFSEFVAWHNMALVHGALGAEARRARLVQYDLSLAAMAAGNFREARDYAPWKLAAGPSGHPVTQVDLHQMRWRAYLLGGAITEVEHLTVPEAAIGKMQSKVRQYGNLIGRSYGW